LRNLKREVFVSGITADAKLALLTQPLCPFSLLDIPVSQELSLTDVGGELLLQCLSEAFGSFLAPGYKLYLLLAVCSKLDAGSDMTFLYVGKIRRKKVR
jgi:hypothetical protein